MTKCIQYNHTVNGVLNRTFVAYGGFNDHKVYFDLGVYAKGSQALCPIIIWREKKRYSVRKILRFINRFFHMASNR